MTSTDSSAATVVNDQQQQLLRPPDKAPKARSYLLERFNVPKELLEECETVQDMILVAHLHLRTKDPEPKKPAPLPRDKKECLLLGALVLNFFLIMLTLFGSSVQFNDLNRSDIDHVWRGMQRLQAANNTLRFILVVLCSQILALICSL
jgi:hypothetical protein